MSESEFYRWLAFGWLGMAGVTFVALLFVNAPYGRFTRVGWGPRLGARLAWVIMEAPAALGMVAFFLLGPRRADALPLFFLGLWLVHYVHRAFVFPFRLRGDRHQATVLTTLLAVVFNLGNTYLNGRALTEFGPVYGQGWWLDPRLLGGVFLFVAGFAINKHADAVLIRLRAPGETGYKIPRGGLYRWISCPNYLGEIVQWGGWALATWNLGALAFFVWTVANLAPRALANHRWYRRQFSDYPPERRALVPFVL